MAGDDDKKIKKKKVKKPEKAEEAAPEPEPEPEPQAEPTPAPEPAAAEGDDWMSAATEEAPAPAGEEGHLAEEQAHIEGAEGDVLAGAPPAPKKKPKFFVHWDRKKAKFYDYNFDYGENYYSSVVNYLDHKNLGSRAEIPRRKAFAERGIDSSLVRKSHPDIRTQSILNEVRSSIRGFESFQRGYAHDMNRKFI